MTTPTRHTVRITAGLNDNDSIDLWVDGRLVIIRVQRDRTFGDKLVVRGCGLDAPATAFALNIFRKVD